jgi:aspartokinase
LSKIKLGGIIQHTNLVRISLTCPSNQVNGYARLLTRLGDANINVHFMVQFLEADNIEMLLLCIDKDEEQQTFQIIGSIQDSHKIIIDCVDPDVTTIGIYGPDFRLRPGLAGALLDAMHSASIPVQAISTSISTFSVIIPSQQLERAFSAIHEVFELP